MESSSVTTEGEHLLLNSPTIWPGRKNKLFLGITAPTSADFDFFFGGGGNPFEEIHFWVFSIFLADKECNLFGIASLNFLGFLQGIF